MGISLVHLEHALPALAELGLEHLIPVLMAGGAVSLDSDAVRSILQGLSLGAQKRSARRLMAISQATGEDLLSWEVDASREAEALRLAALSSFDDAKVAILGFFGSLGLSLNVIPGSSEAVETQVETPQRVEDVPNPV